MDVIGFRMKDLRDAYQVTDNLGKPLHGLVPCFWPGFLPYFLIYKEPMSPPFFILLLALFFSLGLRSSSEGSYQERFGTWRSHARDPCRSPATPGIEAHFILPPQSHLWKLLFYCPPVYRT